MTTDEKKLIAQYINRRRDNAPVESADAQLIDYGVPVWTLIGHLRAVNGDMESVAHDYALPIEAVQAALAYYHRYKTYIDARLLLNSR